MCPWAMGHVLGVVTLGWWLHWVETRGAFTRHGKPFDVHLRQGGITFVFLNSAFDNPPPSIDTPSKSTSGASSRDPERCSSLFRHTGSVGLAKTVAEGRLKVLEDAITRMSTWLCSSFAHTSATRSYVRTAPRQDQQSATRAARPAVRSCFACAVLSFAFQTRPDRPPGRPPYRPRSAKLLCKGQPCALREVVLITMSTRQAYVLQWGPGELFGLHKPDST
ncbi:hypothetical protein N657DRAFT_379359 [Parathielavia appendiculata]|uniref:Secreted protein n=1 Tax=Parathielavia appendiculata TaxID=2587402 RepID=A0AAN6Z4S7_9PEZI|nr:hypothetical protein N657DRAFT_379359 [Parathielavia appendiculata]